MSHTHWPELALSLSAGKQQCFASGFGETGALWNWYCMALLTPLPAWHPLKMYICQCSDYDKGHHKYPVFSPAKETDPVNVAALFHNSEKWGCETNTISLLCTSPVKYINLVAMQHLPLSILEDAHKAALQLIIFILRQCRPMRISLANSLAVSIHWTYSQRQRGKMCPFFQIPNQIPKYLMQNIPSSPFPCRKAPDHLK